MSGHYPESFQHPGLSESKTFCPRRNVWIRKRDCLIAEHMFGYQWMPCSPHRDFQGNPFFAILTLPPLDAAYILEPDTRIPSFSTDICDALKVARKIGLESIPVMPTDRDMAEWIADEALKDIPHD